MCLERPEILRDLGGEFLGVERVSNELGAVGAEGGRPDGGGNEACSGAEERPLCQR